MAILVKDLIGRGFHLPVPTTQNKKIAEDGTLEFTIIENAQTYPVINAIDSFWVVTNVGGFEDKMEYVVVMIEKETKGEKVKLTCHCKEKHIDDLNIDRIYENYTGSLTCKKALDIAFRKTNYKYKLMVKPNAVSVENWGQDMSRYDMIKSICDKFVLEWDYEAKSKTFYFYTSIQKDAKYFINTRINANNLKIESDTTECYTFVKGFGDYDDENGINGAGLIIEFTHPYSRIVGKRHAPMIADGRVTKEKTLRAMCEARIQESMKVSLSFDFLTLKDRFKEADPKPGDIVKVFDDVTGTNDFVRIVEVTTERDPKNRIIKQDVVCGDFRTRTKFRKGISDAIKFVNAVSEAGNSDKNQQRLSKEHLNTVTKATTGVVTASNRVTFDDRGIVAEGGGGSKSKGSVVFGESDGTYGIYYDKDGNEELKPIILKDGLQVDNVPTATSSKNGMMSADDKRKLDEIYNKLFPSS